MTLTVRHTYSYTAYRDTNAKEEEEKGEERAKTYTAFKWSLVAKEVEEEREKKRLKE